MRLLRGSMRNDCLTATSLMRRRCQSLIEAHETRFYGLPVECRAEPAFCRDPEKEGTDDEKPYTHSNDHGAERRGWELVLVKGGGRLSGGHGKEIFPTGLRPGYQRAGGRSGASISGSEAEMSQKTGAGSHWGWDPARALERERTKPGTPPWEEMACHVIVLYANTCRIAGGHSTRSSYMQARPLGGAARRTAGKPLNLFYLWLAHTLTTGIALWQPLKAAFRENLQKLEQDCRSQAPAR
jgi:hypothetical protein